MVRLACVVGLVLGLWLALVGCGASDTKLQPWGRPLADPSLLLSNTVRAIQQSADGALWFGTDGGVSRFEPQSGQWRTYTTQQGLGEESTRSLNAELSLEWPLRFGP